MPLQPGTQIAGRYTVLRPAGRGHDSLVLQAFDEVMGRDVAVKVPPERAHRDGALDQRIRREARVVESLGPHPHIVRLLDVVDHDGAPVLVTEWMREGSLADRLTAAGGAGLGLRETVRVGTAVADALEHAHRLGVIHRDLKPSNVLYDAGRPKLGDFGLFGALQGDTGMTMAGQVTGTPRYMAPEQVAGVSQSPASDVFGLGILLFECFHGRSPFPEHSSLPQRMRALLAPIAIPPSPLADVLGGCLQGDPDARKSADEILRALRELEGAGAALAPTTPVTSPGGSADVATPGTRPPARTARSGWGGAGRLLVAAVVVAAAAWSTATGLLPVQVVVGAATVLLAAAVAWAFRRLVSSSPTADGEDEDVGILTRLEAGEDLTRSMMVQVDDVVARLKAPTAKFLGLSVIALIRDYDVTEDYAKRAELLQQAVTTMEKLSQELSPWYVRYKDAIAIVIAMVGAAAGVATVVTGFLR
ncbi:serine/threonine-protein kinase [Pseudonocardia saturnea]